MEKISAVIAAAGLGTRLKNYKGNTSTKVLIDINQKLLGKVVTKISLLKNYCPAEEYHQKYLEKR